MAANATSVNIRPGSTVPLKAILDFASRMYGPAAHQARENYYRWMYLENPSATEGLGHASVAVTEKEEVVGLLNRLLMPWQVEGQVMVIPGIGDLMVDPAYRQGGLGLRMTMQATRGWEHAFVNGSNPNSSPLFRGLKYQELEGTFWGFRALRPFHMAWQLLKRDTAGSPATIPDRCAHGPFQVADAADPGLMRQLAGLLNSPEVPVKLHWTAEQVRWRFFHPLGPRHFVIAAPGADGGLAAAAVLSNGLRRGLRTAGIMALRGTPQLPVQSCVDAVVAICKEARMDVLTAYTNTPGTMEALRKAGLLTRRKKPSTFFFHRQRAAASPFLQSLVDAAASDLGMEALPR